MSATFLAFLSILGGMALFLHGLAQCRLAFQSDQSSRKTFNRICRSFKGAFGFGFGMAVVTQSTTAATGFAVGLVELGLISLSTSLIVMIGASVGTSLIIFLISFHLSTFAPFGLCFGMIFNRYSKGKLKKIANPLIGLSLVMMGMDLISNGVEPLTTMGFFTPFLQSSLSRPFSLFFISLFITSLVQSSVPVLGLTIALAINGNLPMSSIVPIVLGSRIGTSGLVLLTGLSGKENSRALALAALIFRIAGVLILWPLSNLLIQLSQVFSGNDPSLLISFVQFFVAWLNAFIGIIFLKPLENLSRFLARSRENHLEQPKFIDKDPPVPALAYPLLAREMIRLAGLIDELIFLIFHINHAGDQRRNQLSHAIPQLAETCSQYWHKIPPTEDENLNLEAVNLGYSLSALKELAVISATKLTKLHPNPLDEHWQQLLSDIENLVRQSLRTLAVGQGSMFDKTMQLKEIYRQHAIHWRSKAALVPRLSPTDERHQSDLYLLDRIARCAAELSRGQELKFELQKTSHEELNHALL